MRVLHVVGGFYPATRFGGPSESVLRLNQGLMAAGHEVEVVTTDADGPTNMDIPLNRIVPYRHPIIDYLNEHSDPLAIAVVVVAAIVVAPIAEEFLFRRVLQGWLQTLPLPFGSASAIGLTALAFALAHAGHGLAWLPLLALGAVLGVLVRQTGSIMPAILLHAFFNAVSVGLLLLQLSGMVPAS